MKVNDKEENNLYNDITNPDLDFSLSWKDSSSLN